MNKCALCQRDLEEDSDQGKQAALKEKVDNGWGDIPMEDCVMVCDDCYQRAIQFKEQIEAKRN